MRVIADIAHAIAFLTRLPVPAAAFGDTRLDFARQAWAFPLAALPLAGVASAVGWASLALFGLPSVAGILVVATLVVLTGALHEDGLADCADGFWGAHRAPRRMAIMRDSAIGSYGVLALAIAFSLRAVATGALLSLFGPAAFAALLLAAVAVGRTAIVFPWVAQSPAPREHDGAKGESLASRFGRPDGKGALLAGVICATLVAPAFVATGPVTLFSATVFGGVAALLVTRIASAKIGGHTGDTLGATALLAETGFLLGALVTTSVP